MPLKTAAIHDPSLDILVIAASLTQDIEKAISALPKDGYLSEWEYRCGLLKIKYNVHENERGEQLRAHKPPHFEGTPRFLHLYSQTELETLLARKK